MIPPEAYAAAVACLPSMTPVRLGQLIAEHGVGEELWRAAEGSVHSQAVGRWRKKFADVDARLAAQTSAHQPGDVWERCWSAGIDVLVRGAADFPECLAADREPAHVLFVRGSLNVLSSRRVAIVGTRNATENGRRFATRLGGELADAGVCVVSGLARGIDAAAHRGAVRSVAGRGPAAVVGSGPDRVFPRENAGLWELVAETGVLISEYGPGVEPVAHHFPARNRIIAALSELVVVVESRETGGSLLTVNEAIKRNVDVLAVPGSPLDRASSGTNRIIADGARPVLETSDVLIALDLDTRRQGTLSFDPRPIPAAQDQVLLDMFNGDPLSLDEIVARAGRVLPEVAMGLGRLENAGWLRNDGGWLIPLRQAL